MITKPPGSTRSLATRTRPPSDRPADYDRPARLLERHSEHRRAETLAALAANPHTPHAGIADVLGVLHPAELAWIAEKIDGPAWFLETAASVPAPEDEDDGVLRLLSDDELAQHPDPAAVLQSWLDSVRRCTRCHVPHRLFGRTRQADRG
ncbi:hypothetical protein ACIHCQ_18390 [Streptomyces sp. NPDC052236]|uniref:hypothetical protein n=1 Tax=Streptomyces sp. NPDC052236 TaxID=3365686 RepID=UPI0037CEE912